MATTPGTIKHRHQSVLPVGTSDVDVPQWNDSEVVAGGTNGDALVRDTTQTDGWGWTPLGIYAPLNSPAFTGVPTAPTATPATTSTTQLATTAFVQAALSSGQISFPATQVPSANPNVLDDYEEGTWTPVITADGGASGQTYSAQNGVYTKIGRLVIAQFQVVLSNKGTLTGFIQLGGFPVFGGSIIASFVVDVMWYSMATAYLKMAIQLAGTGPAYVRPATAGTTDLINQTMTTTNLNNTSAFLGVAIYFV